ncbi:hypothetical protein N7532_003536 [Penicillium argentinense]|uniref:USP domain-containing protein n=1 Tax=Penicillium argentinense TaxID=1131581 RepID=A0A9W9KFA7_9EURO|nr:uncharacterized protein N7532_003536 [Penicillium argentinense]KAJ5103007.1 hypothetical protein N7532_003536 [Penicillium argentinense]
MDRPDDEGARTPKRPRVDSGSGIHEFLSIDQAATPAHALVAPSSHAAHNSNSDSSSNPSPSKVTINVKSSTRDMTPESNEDSSAHPPPDSPSQSPVCDATPPHAISVSSSPAQSPHIEIADPEDMEQDTDNTNTNWRPLTEAMMEGTQPEIIDVTDSDSLIDSFPQFNGDMTVMASLSRICLAVEKSDDAAAEFLRAVKLWFDNCTRNLHELTSAAYAQDQDFWPNLPLVIENLLRSQFVLPMDQGEGELAFLRDLFLDYVQITLRLVEEDIHVLRQLAAKSDDVRAPASMSLPYLRTLTFLVSSRGIPFYSALEEEYNTEARIFILDLRAQVLAPPHNATEKLAKYCTIALELAPENHHIVVIPQQIMMLINQLIDRPVNPDLLDHEDPISHPSSNAPAIDQSYEIMTSIQVKYNEWVAKKYSWITSDMSDQILRQVPNAMSSFCGWGNRYVQRLAKDLSIELPEGTTRPENSHILNQAWKFDTLKRQIMEGRMELRVHGMETMQRELHALCASFFTRSPNGHDVPSVRYLIRFVKENKLVEYLVGVDSHSQLITRSSNILLFLVVTHSYTDHETDVIWRAIAESQDNRVTSDILEMLTAGLLAHPFLTAPGDLRYICAKLSSLPLARFDSRMMEFVDKLLGTFVGPPDSQGQDTSNQTETDAEHAHAIPLRLCVHLIRECATAVDLPVDQRTQLQSLVCTRLAQLSRSGISEADRMQLYERCIKDIADNNEFRTGSIHSIYAMISCWSSAELRKLTTEFDLARLVINELRHTVEQGDLDLADNYSVHGLKARNALILRLINHATETVTADLAKAFWNDILLSPRMGALGHTLVWNIMIAAANQSASSGTRNSFLERCIHEYMPALTPKHYDIELMHFAKAALNYQIRLKLLPAAREGEKAASNDEILSIPGMDCFWDFILTAPANSIEIQATKFAIEVYLDHFIIKQAPRSAVHATHVAIVDRCVDQLKTAAARIRAKTDAVPRGNTDTAMDIAGDEDPAELMFSRSLLFLKGFLDGLRSRPQYTSPRRQSLNLPDTPMKGHPMTLSWQSFTGSSNSEVQQLQIGRSSTKAELVEQLRQLTGFSKFDLICSGTRMDIVKDPDTPLRDLEKALGGFVMVRNKSGPEEVKSTDVLKGHSVTLMDGEVKKHFDVIYDCLSLKQEPARQTYGFLVAFPPADWVIARAKSLKSTADDLLPFDKPYEALYMLHTMSTCLRDEGSEVGWNPDTLSDTLDLFEWDSDEDANQLTPEYEYIRHVIGIWEKFLLADELAEPLFEDPIKLCLATTAIGLLLEAITGEFFAMPAPALSDVDDHETKVYGRDDDDLVLYSDRELFVKRLLGFIDMARSNTDPAEAQNAQSLMCGSFSVIVESAIRDRVFWTTLKKEAPLDDLIRYLLLEQTSQSGRISVAGRIKLVSGSTKTSKGAKDAQEGSSPLARAENPSQIDMLATFWQSLVKALPKTLDFATQSAEFYEIAVQVLALIAGMSPEDVVLGEYVKPWSDILFERLAKCPAEFVGRETADDLVLGLATLLEKCLQLTEESEFDFETDGIGERILNDYLFPDLSPDHSDSSADDIILVPRVPILHSATRHKLLEIVDQLSKRNDQNTVGILQQLVALIPRGQQTPRFHDDFPIRFTDRWGKDTQYNASSGWTLDRDKTIRAPAGYAGLGNLSNTCYLNSLMTQLFMNVEFRDFMFKLNLLDPNGSQKLLAETQNVFALLQNSWLKSFDPLEFVESIRTYENENIDVTIQMDVDEFYNLLFDRWEGQIIDNSTKKRLRSFYGGELVQQIKSKECPHVSERFEPFSAIQCEIIGKASLEDSLQAYVEGEIMQGDNKYSCTSCNRHVDAVKRACLKDVPDNLIFHLKRFDFDMINMVRNKINDLFKFPLQIDMAPYNVAYLADPQTPAEPDIFELVGVLVHAGTAETGHYYSYIRERTSEGDSPAWVEFNDSLVSRFDPADIPEQCFGGSTTGSYQMIKSNNAYMLFYQRVSSIEKCKGIFKPVNSGPAGCTSVPTVLANPIAMNNELFIRTYCLFDPAYAHLVTDLLRHVHDMSPDHPEKERVKLVAVDIGMDTFEQLIARNKDHRGTRELIYEISRFARQEGPAMRLLDWVIDHESSLNNLVIKTASAEVRKAGLELILIVLEDYHKFAFDPPPSAKKESASHQRKATEIVRTFIGHFERMWWSILAMPRAWDDYFAGLVSLLKIDMRQIDTFLDYGMLTKFLELLNVDPQNKGILRGNYLNHARLLEKGRRFSYRHLLQLVATLLMKVDLSRPPIPADAPRVISNGKYPPTETEARLLLSVAEEGYICLLMKLLSSAHTAKLQDVLPILGAYLESEPAAGYLEFIVKTLEIGVRFNSDFCIPFLDATVVFCELTPDAGSILGLINYVAMGIDLHRPVAALEHSEFFTSISQITNARIGLSPDWFFGAVQDRLPDFAPALLIDVKTAVRQQMYQLVQRLLFPAITPADPDDTDEAEKQAKARRAHIAHELAPACMATITTLAFEVAERQMRLDQFEILSALVHQCFHAYYDASHPDDSKEIEDSTRKLNFQSFNLTLNAANQPFLDMLETLESRTQPAPDDYASGSDGPDADWDTCGNSPVASEDDLDVGHAYPDSP